MSCTYLFDGQSVNGTFPRIMEIFWQWPILIAYTTIIIINLFAANNTTLLVMTAKECVCNLMIESPTVLFMDLDIKVKLIIYCLRVNFADSIVSDMNAVQ